MRFSCRQLRECAMQCRVCNKSVRRLLASRCARVGYSIAAASNGRPVTVAVAVAVALELVQIDALRPVNKRE